MTTRPNKLMRARSRWSAAILGTGWEYVLGFGMFALILLGLKYLF